ncbi:MAG: hypothetical protein KAH31_00245 [Candidatus Sabulitectum sp.]|nr:hypothetical protein [Candidatus Sabulitectum sp.]
MPDRSFFLTDGDLNEFRSFFKPGHIWSLLLKDAEGFRFWKILREVNGELWIQHGTGAVAHVFIDKDRIISVELLQEEQAEKILRKYGFPVSSDMRHRASKFLCSGKDVHSALLAAWSRLAGLSPLPPVLCDNGITLIRYRFSWQGILEVKVSPEGRVVSHLWYTAGDAMDILNS